MCHVLHVFISLVFPIKFYKLFEMKSWKNRIYIAESIFILIFGILPSLIIAAMSEYQLSILMPVCLTRSPNVFFYTTVLPVSLTAMFGVCSLLGALWALRKVRTRIVIVVVQFVNPTANKLASYLHICSYDQICQNQSKSHTTLFTTTQ